MPTVVRDTIYPKEDYCCSTFQKSLVLKYNFMVCVSSLAIGTFALNSWSNTLLHKFLKKKKKKNVRKQQKKYKKYIVSAIIFYYMYIEIIFTIKVNKQTS